MKKWLLCFVFCALMMFTTANADNVIPSGDAGKNFALAEGILYDGNMSYADAVTYSFTPNVVGQFCISLQADTPGSWSRRVLQIKDQNNKLIQEIDSRSALVASDWVVLQAGISYSIVIYGNDSSIAGLHYYPIGDFSLAICTKTLHADWAEPIIQKYANCTEKGYSDQTCRRCATVRTVNEVPATGHQTGDWIVETEPTCGMEGLEFIRCQLCLQRVQTHVIESPAHTPGTEWTVVQAPNCTSAGYQAHLCTVCGKATDYFELPATGHVKSSVPTSSTSASCTEDTFDLYYCDQCHQLLERILTTPALGHQWGEWEIIQEAFPDIKGYRSHSCIRCAVTRF